MSNARFLGIFVDGHCDLHLDKSLVTQTYGGIGSSNEVVFQQRPSSTASLRTGAHLYHPMQPKARTNLSQSSIHGDRIEKNAFLIDKFTLRELMAPEQHFHGRPH